MVTTRIINKTMKNQAKVSLLIPFQGWCLEGRGIHKHYGLFEVFKAFKEKKRYNNQRTKCFCPTCDNELCGSDSHLRSVSTERGYFEMYQCSCCTTKSVFDFDAPVPILVENIH